MPRNVIRPMQYEHDDEVEDEEDAMQTAAEAKLSLLCLPAPREN